MNTGRASVLVTAVVAAAACLLPAHAFASCDGQGVRSGPITLDVGPVHRLFVLHVPSAGEGRTPSPVLFAFHPFGMNAQYMQSRVSSRFWQDAILVYPEGLSRPGAGPSWQGRPGESGDRDLQFFDAMLAWLAVNTCADARRVFVMGYSNGAALANVIACARADVIAGVAMASGRLACQPAAPLPVIVTHGLRDPTVGYDQALASSKAWSSVNGCAAPPRAGAPGCAAAQSCASAPMTLCTHGGGHEYSSTFTRSMMEFFQKAKP